MSIEKRTSRKIDVSDIYAPLKARGAHHMMTPVSTRRVFMTRNYLHLRWIVIVMMVLLPLTVSAQSAKFREFPNAKPKAGDMAPDSNLKTVDGEDFQLSKAVAEQPVVIEFGSYT
jgi:hypothetical protein